MTKPILVVEDETDIADLVKYHLKQAHFPVEVATEGAAVLETVKKKKPALIILDLMLPGMDGKDICRALKSNPVTKGIPILMLTAKAEEVDRVIGFELGADDYVTKPFSPRELVLRVRAILQRVSDSREPLKTYHIGALSIDVDRHEVKVRDRPVRLTATEFKLLLELASRRGRVLTREHLLNSVWGYTYEGYARTVDTHVRRLRERLGSCGDYIETLRGVGYRFREDVE